MMGKKAENSRYADTPLPVQMARCGLVVFLLGKALLSFPDDLEGTSKEKDALEKVSKWHDKVLKELDLSQVSKAGLLAINAKVGKFDKLVKAASKKGRFVVKLWCAVILLWDARVMCPAVARTSAWRYLDMASDRLARAMSKHCENGEEEATKIYEELAW